MSREVNLHPRRMLPRLQAEDLGLAVESRLLPAASWLPSPARSSGRHSVAPASTCRRSTCLREAETRGD